MGPVRFGIFMPVKDGISYLQDAIESVIAQNRGDWNLFILDNASSDGTAELVATYRDPRIHIYRSESPLSIWESWHRVWCLVADNFVHVEYITIIGHDDILLPTFLDSISNLIARHPNASLYQTGFDMIDQDGNLIRPCRPIPSYESSEDFLAARLWGIRDSFGTGYVFRSVDYVKVGGIPNMPSLLYADDLLFARLSRLAYKAALSDSQCLYRLHRMSASNQMTALRIKNQIGALVEYIEHLEKEFPEFINSQAGKNALANLLAREVKILAPLGVVFLLGDETSYRVAGLAELYSKVSILKDYRKWLGTNFISQNIYSSAKRIALLYAVIRDKFPLNDHL